MEIRPARQDDIAALSRLLYQIHQLHADGRPDLFRPGACKYTPEQLQTLLLDTSRPVFAAVEGEELVGYAFCVLQRAPHASMTDILTLYIDDLCVDAAVRGKGIGTALYRFVVDYARSMGCYNVTLNVWSCNPDALRFYRKCGLQTQKLGLEHIL